MDFERGVDDERMATKDEGETTMMRNEKGKRGGYWGKRNMDAEAMAVDSGKTREMTGVL